MCRADLIRRWGAAFLLAALWPGARSVRGQDAEVDGAARIGLQQGICVVLGDVDCRTALRLVSNTELLVYVQLADEEDYQAACRAADAAGVYGKRIFIGQGEFARIGLADNLADALLVQRGAAGVLDSEVLRVLRPGGTAHLDARRIVKPVPEGLDDWSHPYHGGDNNPQSNDRVIKAPYLTQFLAEPYYGPLPQVAVAAAGRIFKAFGHIAFKVREEPYLNTLVAFNGYNGTMLWKHKLSETYMIHRNTIIAEPDRVYVADDKSCKVLDAVTGQVIDEIVPPEDLTEGTFWKWMAMEGGVLYAMVGQAEKSDPVIMGKRDHHGWPWDPLSPGFNQRENPWGYGRTIMAIDPTSKRVLWHYREDKPIDSRATCMKDGRIFAFAFGEYLTCLDARDGSVIWRKSPADDGAIFKSLGGYSNRQDWRTNWRTTAYLKCGDKALYFAGPQVNKLLAVSVDDGRILWEHPYNNFQIIIREDAVYGISGQIDDGSPSRKFHPLTGEVLAEIAVGRRACTRPTGSPDSIFFRANGGSTRLDTESDTVGLISPMRPPCHDGVTIANGMLYWWPSVCDCNLTLYGLTALGSAGDFDFGGAAAPERLLQGHAVLDAPLELTAEDWPTFRANNAGNITTTVAVPEKVKVLWEAPQGDDVILTAPTAAGGLVFAAADDGIVRAVDARTGQTRWKAYVGGAVRIAPTVAEGLVFVGSGDGRVYALEAKTGRTLWRFCAAVADRRIPVYGKLMSTWPAASGVLVQDGVAYAAAGIANYDGTHVYALDAATGQVKWRNSASGHLDAAARSGVGVQGHMLLLGDKLVLAGGNAVSPAIYDMRTGRCLNDPGNVQNAVNNNVPASLAPRGWELFQIGDGVVCAGKPFYSHPEYDVYDQSVFSKTLLATSGEHDITWVNNSRLVCYPKVVENRHRTYLAGWGKFRVPGLEPRWQYDCAQSTAAAVCRNAVVVADKSKVTAVGLGDGAVLWSKSIVAAAVPWGMAIDSGGRVIVALKDGRIICLGGE